MADEAKNEEQGTQEEPKKKFPVMLIVFVLVVVLLLGGGAFAWKSGMLDGMLGKEGKEAVGKTAEESKPDIGPIYNLGSFIVNLMEPLGKRYLKVKVELELDNEETRAEIERRLPQFKDAVLTMLSSKSYEDISDLSGKYQLRAEMQSVLDGYLKNGKIANVYFTEFIVQ
ncbi:MAG: flagellar basal body-associated FliL family protein [Deltaproteobacteria bacterium]|nr:flagellar basal body-associated FliL family protein [Deltaproteobacteria bacterium]MBW1922746.1 flagellar basal body-associated FliL family protein [Deltaproteobacteria bacterium]MBW1948188.1 flagellar basal body-associated FliL family protein [Deltaproteobacteria bacterium]MBW2007425.1 flagellar basal body-associated FliL family protein [Deltaproteobacteria bacterium]MBW2347148.1 flagellar basal body-associated FliL family protein [Deltaproteobacteria bacterium]